MSRLRAAAAWLRRNAADALAAAGFSLVAVGIGAAWPPAGLVAAGLVCLYLSREAA
ncbi:MAG: hypothetical protein U0838_13080 [Chloroflexota bacterium]